MAASRVILSFGVLLVCSGGGDAEQCDTPLDDAIDELVTEVGLLQYKTELEIRSQPRLKAQSAETARLRATQPPSLAEVSTEVALAEDPIGDVESLLLDPVEIDYGDDKCKCIGLDRVPGSTSLDINGTVVQLPSNFGSRCAPWYHQHHPKCMKDPMPEWCSQPFCYVDPCTCKQPVVPRVDPYNRKQKWKNMPMYYSFTTCGSVDTFTAEESPGACVNQETQGNCDKYDYCSWSLTASGGMGGGCVGGEISGSQCSLHRQSDQYTWGTWKCACQGIAFRDGAYKSELLNVTYPGDAGATCKAWHNNVHPDCQGPDPKPSWCTKNWCFVDPCKCDGVVPKVDSLFPGGDFAGISLYYSFDTCNNADTYTETMNPDACSNLKTEEDCALQKERCRWSFLGNQEGSQCRGIEVATNCVQTPWLQIDSSKKDGAGRHAPQLALMLLTALLFGATSAEHA